MSLKHHLRLCFGSKFIFNHNRFYSLQNTLILRQRGMYENVFPEKSEKDMTALLLNKPQCVYAGFDPTADSLHIGNLLILMNLLHWQRGGHRVIALIGGATGLIGDPSHRESEREQMDTSFIQNNVEHIKNNIQTVFDNHSKYFWDTERTKLKSPTIVDNLKWYKELNVIKFIREYGKYFRLGTMLGRTSVQSRLNSEIGMSFTEFSYSLFQAYDWYYLWKNYECHFQIGGNDQQGNIMAGHDLISRTSNNTQVYGLTVPLVTTQGGRKFGKSSNNAVWLSPNKSSSFQLYQFFIRTPDADVERFLKFFTFLSVDKINLIVEDHKKNPEKREAQQILAKQVTLLVHGEEGLKSAENMSEILYNKSMDKLSTLTINELSMIFEDSNVIGLVGDPGLTAYELALKAKCFKSEHDAVRIIQAGGFYINNQKITNLSEIIVAGIHILSNNVTLLRTGKKTYTIIKWL